MKTEHQRSIIFKTKRKSNGLISIEAQLKDFRYDRFFGPLMRATCVHHMTVAIEIDSQMLIKSARFITVQAPYLECQSFPVGAEKLLGLSLHKGFTREVLNLYGGTSGCSHVLTILLQLSAAARQGFAFVYRFAEDEKALNEETLVPTVQKMAVFIADTCMVWRKDSIVQKEISQGRLRDLPNRLYPSFARRFKHVLKKFE